MAEDAIHRWNAGALDSRELIRAFRDELWPIVRHQTTSAGILTRDWVNDQGVLFRASHLEEALRKRRTEGIPFSASDEFLAWAAAEVANATRKWHLTLARLSRRWRDASPPDSILRSDPVPDRLDLPEHEQVDLFVSMNELADAASRASDTERPLVRLLALRVVGGWSLREIAKRDELTLDRVAEMWVEARSWIQQRAPNSSTATRIATFDLLDLRVIQALISDRRLAVTMEWRAFEKMLAMILASLEYEIELQRGTRDGGVDILAIKKDSIFGPHRYLLQAKRWSNRVGVEPVRELLFLQQHYGATKSCLATTSSFTAGAWQLANEYRWQLELRDYDRLQEWVNLAVANVLG